MPISDFIAILKHHGLSKGLVRFYEEVTENKIFDLMNGVETSRILTNDSYYKNLNKEVSAGAMHYQPTYYSTLKKPFKFIVDNYKIPQEQLLIVDLGVGKGKPLIIANKFFKSTKLIGVDLSTDLLQVCKNNLTHIRSNFELINESVTNIDYAKLFENYKYVIVHNKNSFDENVTKASLDKIKLSKGDRTIFYIYNNPVYAHLFGDMKLLFNVKGWHKNHNLNLYQLDK